MQTMVAATSAPIEKANLAASIQPPRPSEADDQRAEEYERRVAKQMQEQFQRLKDEAHALYGMVQGRPGVIGPSQWAQLLDKAGDEIGNGRFIVRYLGAERYLDAATVAALITLRQNLLADVSKPSAADMMRIDTAVVSYYNFLRVQGWIGNLALVFEQELFGGKPFNEIHGETIGARLRDQLEHLADVLIPIQERTQRMMVRALDGL